MWLKRVHLWDQRNFMRLFNLSQSPSVHRFGLWCSKTGDGPFYVLLLLTLWLAGSLYSPELTALLLICFAIELPLYFVLKNSIRRRRPYQRLTQSIQAHIEASDRFSLPSGHTAAAFVMACAISVYYPTWSAVAYTWASLIGVSRVLLGVHYPLDIVAGALLGYSSFVLAFKFL